MYVINYSIRLLITCMYTAHMTSYCTVAVMCAVYLHCSKYTCGLYLSHVDIYM